MTPKTPPSTKARVAFVSLGCPKNLVDSEVMLGSLGGADYTVCNRPEDADVVIVNTCGFLEASKTESLGVIREMMDLKRDGALQRVVVAGCLAQRDAGGIQAAVPGIDAILGVNDRDRLVEICDDVVARPRSPRRRAFPDPDGTLLSVSEDPSECRSEQARLRLTPRHYAYLKISEGCDNPCTFCTIPSIRGVFRSKPPAEALREATELAADGARELIVIAQDSTYYGADLPGKPKLGALLESLARVPGVDWLRLMYAYPRHFDDDLFRIFRETPQIAKYLDMPIQHISDTVLQRMRRGGEKRIRKIIGRCRAEIPDLTLRTTVIVGFPGETDAEFGQLLAFLREARFERLGAFKYSLEPGTPAGAMAGQIPEEVKESRWKAVMEQQQKLVFERNATLIGRTVEAIIDAPPETPRGRWIGRTMADAPDIDPQIFLKGKALRTGSIVPAKITASRGYDLEGTVEG